MKMYTMDDFINGKLAVRVNEDNQKDFLKMCEVKGLRWLSGGNATERYYPGAATIEYVTCDFSEGLGFSYEHQLGRLSDRTIVDFSQIINPHVRKITIDCDGNTITAKMIVNGKEVKTATAKRNPADKANWRIGAQLAFDRLWKRKEMKEEQKKEGVFKPGDRVVHVSYGGDNFVCGKHGTVLGVDKKFVAVEFDENIHGHDCGGFGLPKLAKDGHGWWCGCNSLRHE